MRFCSEVTCSCTLAKCFTLKSEDSSIYISNSSNRKAYHFTVDDFRSLVESRDLVLGEETFTEKVYKKLEGYLDNL